MTAGVAPAAVDGMSAALGVNFLAGQQVNVRQLGAFGHIHERLSNESPVRCSHAAVP